MTTTQQLLGEVDALLRLTIKRLDQAQQCSDSQAPPRVIAVPSSIELVGEQIGQMRAEFDRFETALREQIAREIEARVIGWPTSDTGTYNQGIIAAANRARGRL